MSETNNKGKIIQVIGAVVDAEFEEGSVPEIYDALQVDFRPSDAEEEVRLTLDQEVLGSSPRGAANSGPRSIEAPGALFMGDPLL